MCGIGGVPDVTLAMVDGDPTAIVVSPFGVVQISAGRAGIRVRLTSDELLDLAARCVVAAQTADRPTSDD